MKKINFIFLFLFYCSLCVCQSPSINALLISTKKLDQKTSIGFDGMGNEYYIDYNVLSKQNESQNWEYKNLALGKITSVDFINPLKIVVFYEDFNTIVLLDNQLNEIQKINFFEIDNSILVSNIGMCAQNQIWLYNAVNQKIVLYNFVNKTFKAIGNPIQETLKHLQTDFNNLYWIDKNNNWYSIDIFGRVTLIALVPSFDKIQIIDNEKLLYVKDGSVFYMNNKSNSILKIEIVEKSFENFYYKDQILAIFTNQLITNYKIKLP